MEFKVSVYNPSVKEGAKSHAPVLKEEQPKKRRWEELGIRVPKMWAFPTCEFCDLEDAGKKASERPDLKHHLTCSARSIGPKPFVRIPVFDGYGRKVQGKFEDTERLGSFKGEAPTISLTVPVRLVRMIPERDPDGNIIKDASGKQSLTPICTYDRKTYPVEEHCWNGTAWVPWFVYLKQRSSDQGLKEKPAPYYETLRGSWLAYEKTKNKLDEIADEMLEKSLPWEQDLLN